MEEKKRNVEVRISKKALWTGGTLLILLVIAGILWSQKGNTRVIPYAGVSADDLPRVVGESDPADGFKIPFTEKENYREYTEEVLSKALASREPVLMYFYANWCGTCAEQEPANQIFFDGMQKEGKVIMGIRVNVDDHEGLMEQYGISYQHAYALIDKNGKVMDRFYGDHTVEELRAKVNLVL